MELRTDFWRRCSSCKNAIEYQKTYFVCSVSTCTRKRTGYVFCTVHCWERHLPGARHRDAAAIEAKAPTFETWKKELESEGLVESGPPSTPTVASSREPQRVIVRETTANAPSLKTAPPKEILIVVSKLKAYIRERSDMNTSDSVIEALSDQLRQACDKAIEKARADGRKTVMDRDFK